MYIFLSQVLAQRCLESGIIEFNCDLDPVKDSKTDKFLRTLEENGLKLSEPERFMPHRPWDMDRKEKPWEVIE